MKKKKGLMIYLLVPVVFIAFVLSGCGEIKTTSISLRPGLN